MCGIAGFVGKKEISDYVLKSTLELMKNRGPDNQNFLKIENKEKNILFLHSRLSIIDLNSRSSQPFCYNDMVCIFNGEIYNYIEIRETLKKEGHSFKTNSDTEVLLKSYLHYGKKCVDYFEGMWSFAIYNKKTKELFLSRDRFGEKPLYYLRDSNNFIFGSEIKYIQSLLEKNLRVDLDYLRRFLSLGHKSLYKDNKCSFFHGIEELKPGESLIFKNDKIKKIKYWEPKVKIKKDFSRKHWVQKTRESLIKSLELRMRADVPLSFCLSGGVDSGSLVSIASKIFGRKDIHTFSIIDTDNRYNESNEINTVVKDTGCTNTSISLDQKDYFNELSLLSRYRNGPVATCSYFVHSLLTKEIKEKGFKIGISGVGADEMFTGYFDHFSFYLKHLKDNQSKIFNKSFNDWSQHIKRKIRNPLIVNLDNFYKGKHRDHIYLNSNSFNSYLLKDYPIDFKETKYTNESELRNRMLNEMFHEVVRVILHQDDMNSMYCSVENRSPFLDKNLFNMTMNIPTSYLINDGYNKSILRDAMKGILHDDIRLFREKKGFNASVSSFLDLESKKFKDFMLKDSLIYEVVDKKTICNLLKNKTYKNSYNKFVFRIVSSKIFLDQL